MQTCTFASGNPANHSLHLLLVVCFLFFTVTARAGDYNYTATDGQVTITGYTGTGGAVVIPATIEGLPVTRIGDHAMQAQHGITSVQIPAGVVSIGVAAFSNCSNLTAAVIPPTVEVIGGAGFSNNPKLSSVNIPNGLLSLGECVFQACPSLTTITIPSSVTSMGNQMFENCSGLASATILANISQIGEGSFYGCANLTNVILPSGLTSLSDSLFHGCGKLTTITIPAGVTTIGSRAFQNCRSLTDFNLSGPVQTVGDYAFSGCWKLTSAHFPAGLIAIGQEAFSYCQALASITLPAGLTRIDTSAFIECSSLQNVVIPASVTSIGASAFTRCASITSFTVEEANPNYRSLDGVLYDKNVTKLMCYPSTRPGSYTVPDGVVTIDPYAVSGCGGLTGISMPSSVTTIGDGSFSSCALLKSVTFPSSVSWVGSYAFINCGQLAGVVFTGSAPATGTSVFDTAAPGFTVYYQQGSTGFTSPLWMGYPAVALAANQEISVKGPLGELLTDGSGVLDFGYNLPGASQTKIITIANAGGVPLNGISVSIDGPAAAEFLAGNPTAAVLAPGMSTTFSVTYTAGTAGLRSATLHVTSNDEDESPFDIPLSGMCTPTPVPEITVFQSANGVVFEDGVSVLNPGTTEVGTFVVTGITIRNTGTGDMHGIAITLDGANAADFAFTATPPTVLAPGASFSCTVKFSPKAVGTRNAQLHISSDDTDENPFDLTLSASAIPKPAPEITIEPSSGPVLESGVSSIAFGSVLLGSQSATQTFTIRNSGNAYLQNIAITKYGSNASDFITSNLSKTTLLGGESMIFTIRFQPSAIGERAAVLRIASNDADENPFEIQLSGACVAISAPEITVTGVTDLNDGISNVSFGAVAPGEPIQQKFTIGNHGTVDLENLAITIDGANADDFSVSELSSSTLAPWSTIMFTVTFTPGANGLRTASIHIACNDPDETPFDFSVNGTGEPPTYPDIAVTSSGIDLTDGKATVGFTPTLLGYQGSIGFLISNKGEGVLRNLSLTIDGPDAASFVRPGYISQEVSPAGLATFNIRFIPSRVGNFSATLHILSNDADESSFDIKLTGTAIPLTPEIDVLQPAGKSLKDGSASYAFGALAVKKKTTKEFMIRNIGSARLSNISIKKDGPHAADFIVAPLAASVVATSSSMTFKVTFKPKAKGLRKAAIHIKSNDADESSFDINLTGKGVAPASARESLVDMTPGRGITQDVSISRTRIDGLTYRTLTIVRMPGEEFDEPVVEVSSNLIDWFSGADHTTVVTDDANKLVVRDNTPVTPETKRYIRLKSPPTGRVPRRGVQTP